MALNETHLYVCGTYAFSPACTYIVSVPMKDGDGDGSPDLLWRCREEPENPGPRSSSGMGMLEIIASREVPWDGGC